MTDIFRPPWATSREGASSAVDVLLFVVVEVTDVTADVVVLVEVEVLVDDAVEDVVAEVEVLDDGAVEDVVEDVVVAEVEVLDDDAVEDVVLPGSTTASQRFCMLSIPSQGMMQWIWNDPVVPAMN